jgi:hypothetical protein
MEGSTAAFITLSLSIIEKQSVEHAADTWHGDLCQESLSDRTSEEKMTRDSHD